MQKFKKRGYRFEEINKVTKQYHTPKEGVIRKPQPLVNSGMRENPTVAKG